MTNLLPGMVGMSAPQLQTTIAASTSTNDSTVVPHHPITCSGNIFYDEDGTFRCDHASAPPDNLRSKQCVTHSIALLIIELALQM